MKRRARFPFAVLLLGASLVGCSGRGCGSEQKQASPSSGVLEIPAGELPNQWRWHTVERPAVSLPPNCSLDGPTLRTDLQTQDLRFAAVPDMLFRLAVAQGRSDSGTAVRRGALGFRPDGGTDVVAFPWLYLDVLPPIAGSSAGWVAVLEQQQDIGSVSSLWLWREGRAPERLAEGDQLVAIDLRCTGEHCVVLTLRPGAVATRHVSLWFGAIQSGVGGLARHDVDWDIAEDAQAAVVSGLAGWAPQARTAWLSVSTPDGVGFVDVTPSTVGSRQFVDLPSDEHVLDAQVTSKGVGVVVSTVRESCTTNALVRVSSPDRSMEIKISSVPPTSGFLRTLGRGLLATWISAVNCEAPERKVVYAQVLDADGAPTSAGTYVLGDASGYAVTTSGDVLHVWLRDPTGVTWIRGKCAE